MDNIQDYSVLFNNAFCPVGILFTCGKHLHHSIISLRGRFWVHKTSIILPSFIEVPLPSQKNDQSCMYASARCIDVVSFCDFDIWFWSPTVWYFRITPTVWYFCIFFFILFTNVYINYQYCYGQHDHIYTVLDIDLTQIDRYLIIHRID